MADTVNAAAEVLQMEKDFPPPPPPPVETPKVETPPDKKEVVMDLGNGEVFKGETWEEVAKKLGEGKKHATDKIKELTQRKPVEPEKELKYEALQPKPLSEADVLAIKEGFNADPLAAFRKMFAAETGITPEEDRAQENARREQQARLEAERAFVNAHKDDFVPNAENSQKIYSILQKEGLPVTKRNLEWALQQAGEVVKPQPVSELPPPPPKPTVREIPPPPVSISANFGERVETGPGDGGVDAAEMAKIATLPPAEMKTRIEELFRRGRTSAR